MFIEIELVVQLICFWRQDEVKSNTFKVRSSEVLLPAFLKCKSIPPQLGSWDWINLHLQAQSFIIFNSLSRSKRQVFLLETLAKRKVSLTNFFRSSEACLANH